MNEQISLKLHNSHKIVCFIVCFVIVLSMLTVSVFADEGVYNLNGLFNFRIPPSNMTGDIYSEDGSITISPFTAYVDEFETEATVRLLGVNYLQITPSKIGITAWDGNNLSGFTFEVSDGTFTETFDAINVSFEATGNTAYVVIDGSVIPLTFTGMPTTMRFNGMFTTTTIDTDYFIEYFGRIEEYDGNPWVDILTGVVTALDVNIFGTFSYLDIISTLAGACLTIWLLKMLAGG